MALNGKTTVNDELEGTWQQLWPILRYYSSICLKVLNKITKKTLSGYPSSGPRIKLGGLSTTKQFHLPLWVGPLVFSYHVVVTLLTVRLWQPNQVKQSCTLQGFQHIVIVVEAEHSSQIDVTIQVTLTNECQI
jgi:hypothetical protein